MENEEIMMNEETSTEELVPVEDNAIDDTALTVEENSAKTKSSRARPRKLPKGKRRTP